ncbi:CHAT domain-containing protein [Fischerella muscicola CCMEE 5323]|uniref:CHAT domain-containing protein n=2 Tax=Hapalosiphonaceae TaxID=1892263 RepID=A0A2N6K8D5_FISMU|nr:CHAT domain-containing protein [Fischerella muscicola CCMEE 5323]
MLISMGLSKEQRKKLQEALIDAFPTTASLEQMLSFELDKSLDAIVGGGSLATVVFNLIKVADSQGWVENLVRAACQSNPGNSNLKAIAEELLTESSFIVPPAPSPEPLTQPNQQQKILILAAIPHGLRLDKEIREIEEAIRRSVRRDLFEIRVRTAVRPQDIRRAIAEEQPQIVHFCGHGQPDGSLVLEDDGGNNKPVSPEGLASLFELHTDYVKCVLLNTCYSQQPAEAIRQHINYVIGMNNPIKDKAAIAFAQGFYDGLGYKNSGNQDVFQRAFKEGMAAIMLENPSQGSIPVLRTK